MDCGSYQRAGDERGQVAVAFVAVVPLLLLLALALVQFALAGHAALTAANAARAAARADYAGADPERAAMRALPPSFRPGAVIGPGSAGIEVELDAPRALPFVPAVPVAARARLGPSDGVPGG